MWPYLGNGTRYNQQKVMRGASNSAIADNLECLQG